MTIAYKEIPPIPMDEILADPCISPEILVKEASFTTLTGCGPSFDITEFEISCFDEYTPKYEEFSDPVIVEQTDICDVLSKKETDILQQENKQLKDNEAKLQKLLKENAYILQDLKRPWWKF